MGKKKHAEHVNHERWLVSYADLLTLLFAFFVVLFASSVSDKKKTTAMAAVFFLSLTLEAKRTTKKANNRVSRSA